MTDRKNDLAHSVSMKDLPDLKTSRINQQFAVRFQYDVFFTDKLFDPGNEIFRQLIERNASTFPVKILFVLDDGLLKHHPRLFDAIRTYIKKSGLEADLGQVPVIIPGGEEAKNHSQYADQILRAIDEIAIDRHSFVVAIGGGAVIDTAGYAAGIAHRGIRLIRIPTTILAQNDASVGVKNGINAFGKKNFLGTFVPPFAVINDFSFLQTLDQRDWISGISEAIKVALLKDIHFFDFVEENAQQLQNREMAPMKKLIYRCAELHLEHIASNGDPFEMGSSRPLDFGHWAAHKLEQLSNYELRHGEAVAIGIALDVTYSYLMGMIDQNEWERILRVVKESGFRLYVPELQNKLDQPGHNESLLHGLDEFREHLGGKLTIMLLEGIGKGTEVHEVNLDVYREAIDKLSEFESANNELLNAT